uniref:Uncharacterized protein n=1 Tax=Takifugu rubripes TaxID=31033 RepID=A0A674NDL7_TAKRU
MEWVSKMKRVGHTEVNIQEDADYYLVFCPVKSRIKTDIDEALEGLPVVKAEVKVKLTFLIILVVMHHTFDPDLMIVESRLQELPRNVRLTVDSLFHQGRLLRCNRNDIAWNQIQKTFIIPIPEVRTQNLEQGGFGSGHNSALTGRGNSARNWRGHASGLKREGEHQRLQAALRITSGSEEHGGKLSDLHCFERCFECFLSD